MPGTPAARQFLWDGSVNFIGRDRASRSPFAWRSCPECFIEYVALAPSGAWMREIYRDAGETSTVMDEAATETALRLWDREVTEPGLSVVDLGCGRGLFLQALKQRGHRVLGIEPNRRLREVSPLRPGEIIDPDGDVPESLGIDVLSLQLSFEHLQDPWCEIRPWIERMNPGGRLFLMYHDADGWAHQLLAEDSPLWDVQHLQLLNPDAAEVFCERLGLKVITDRGYANSYSLAYWGRLLGLKLSDDSVWGRWRMWLPAGNRILIARRGAKS